MAAHRDAVADLSALSLREDEMEPGEPYAFYNGPLREEFYSLECPFKWSEDISREKLQEIHSYSREFLLGDPREWQPFCTNIYFAFCKARLGLMDEAMQFAEACREVMYDAKNEEFYADILDGAQHALKATMANIHFLQGETEEADQLMDEIIPLQELNDVCRGAVIAIHATASHDFGLKPKEENLAMFRRVIVLDPDEKGLRRGAWFFAVGKLIGQLRRMYQRYTRPSAEELHYLELAIGKKPYPICLAVLAESYREYAKGGKSTDEYYMKSRDLFKILSEIEDSGTLRRCGNGLLKLPAKYQDVTLARQCLEKAVELNPSNSPAYHALACLHENYGDWNEAVKYYQLSIDNGNWLSALSLMKLHTIKNKNYNPIKDINEYLKMPENRRNGIQATFYALKGEYYLFVEDDLMNAAKEWKTAIEIDPKSDRVLKHQTLFQPRYKKNVNINKKFINIYDCLRKAMEGAPTLSLKEKAFLDSILQSFDEKK